MPKTATLQTFSEKSRTFQNVPQKPWAQPASDLLLELTTSERGLTVIEAEKRLKIYGLNEISKQEKKPALFILLSQFTNPLVLVLILASIVAFFLGEQTDAVIILGIVIINALLGFVQEFRAEKTLRSLRKLISQSARVLRDGMKITLDAKNLVPGDIIFLGIGDIVPADVRLLQAEDLSLDESSLTGESAAVQKSTEPLAVHLSLPQDLKNMAFMGTHVVSGSGLGVVTATRDETFFGKTASFLKEPEEISDFEKSIGEFSKFLLKVIAVMTVFIFLVNAVLAHGILESFLFALALAVGITPEALPIIITISLSKGAQILAKAHVVVKRLSSIEDLGNMDILCTDKTGTLTQGKLSLQQYLNPDEQEDPKVLMHGLLCNDAIACKGKYEGNLIDCAIFESPFKKRVWKEFQRYKVLDHNEFDFERRRMSVVIEDADGKRFLVVKGALESLLEAADEIMLRGKKQVLDAQHKQNYLEMVGKYRESGYSTIALAIKPWKGTNSSKNDEKGLTLTGFLTFLDPPRKDAKAALKRMHDLGVQIKVLSGDDPLVTKVICEKVGLKVYGDKIFTGDELDQLNDQEFSEIIERYNVFSRIAPAHKYRIVKTLNKGENRTIAFMGDGINDAPAIKAADVGISVDTATDIAKEAADIILLQNGLQVIVDGVIEGRKIFSNMTKYILNTVSANYGNMFTVAASSFFLKFIPLLPSQILLNNLITDTPMMAIASDTVDPQMLKKPRKLDIKMIRSFMTFFGLLSTVFDMTLIVSLLFVFRTAPELFRTAWFFQSALSEVLVTFAIRTKQPFYKSKPGKVLTWISVGIVVVLFGLVYTPVGSFFELVPINSTIMLLILGITVFYFVAAEIGKRVFFKKFEF